MKTTIQANYKNQTKNIEIPSSEISFNMIFQQVCDHFSLTMSPVQTLQIWSQSKVLITSHESLQNAVKNDLFILCFMDDSTCQNRGNDFFASDSLEINEKYLKKDEFYNSNSNEMSDDKLRKEANFVVFESWPVDMNFLYVDGNNMLFLTQVLRQNTLGRNKIRSEKIIVGAVEEFCSMYHLDTVIVIYDNTSEVYEKILKNGTKLIVTSANPHFKTSDDALVIFNERKSKIERNKSLVVSSDVALCGRLSLIGTNVIRCKVFFNLILKAMNRIIDLDDWFSQLNEALSSSQK